MHVISHWIIDSVEKWRDYSRPWPSLPGAFPSLTSLSNDVTLYWWELTVDPDRRLNDVDTTLRKSELLQGLFSLVVAREGRICSLTLVHEVGCQLNRIRDTSATSRKRENPPLSPKTGHLHSSGWTINPSNGLTIPNFFFIFSVNFASAMTARSETPGPPVSPWNWNRLIRCPKSWWLLSFKYGTWFKRVCERCKRTGVEDEKNSERIFCDLQALERVVDWFGMTFQDWNGNYQRPVKNRLGIRSYSVIVERVILSPCSLATVQIFDILPCSARQSYLSTLHPRTKNPRDSARIRRWSSDTR